MAKHSQLSEHIGYIYLIQSPTFKCYIGQTKNPSRRFKEYEVSLAPRQTNLNYSFLKHGFISHTISILKECPIDELNYWETFYITLFDSVKSGLNCRMGGKVHTFSEESRKRMSIACMGRKMSAESIEKSRLANLGKKATGEQKRKRSESMKGKVTYRKGAIQAFKNGELIGEFLDCSDAARKLNISQSGINNVVLGKRTSSFGITFKRIA